MTGADGPDAVRLRRERAAQAVLYFDIEKGAG